MFKECKHCGTTFEGMGYFCSDMCEIKNHASEVILREEIPISPEVEKNNLTGISTPVQEVIESPMNVEMKLEAPKINI